MRSPYEIDLRASGYTAGLYFSHMRNGEPPSRFFMAAGATFGTSAFMSGARSMLSFVTSQAIALSQVKAKEVEPTNASQDHVGAARHRPKAFFRRLLEALVKPRTHKAGCEADVHRRLDPRDHQ